LGLSLVLRLRLIYSRAVFACAIAAPAGFEPDRRGCFCGGSRSQFCSGRAVAGAQGHL